MQALDAAGAQAAELPLEEGLRAVARAIDACLQDGDLSGLDKGDRAILRFLPRLTLAPRAMDASKLEPLRAAGLDDTALHDVVQVCCCFSFMNRLADGLGVGQAEPNRDWAIKLFGEERWETHLVWTQGGSQAS